MVAKFEWGEMSNSNQIGETSNSNQISEMSNSNQIGEMYNSKILLSVQWLTMSRMNEVGQV